MQQRHPPTPLEKFIVSAELEGISFVASAPQPQCQLKATNDYQAARLRSKHGLTSDEETRLKAPRRQRQIGGGSGASSRDWTGRGLLSKTQRAYRKEAERVLLWAITYQGKALSSMSKEDCIEYRGLPGRSAAAQPLVRSMRRLHSCCCILC